MLQVKTKSTQREEILDKGVSGTAVFLSFYFSLFPLFPLPLNFYSTTRSNKLIIKAVGKKKKTSPQTKLI